MLVEDLDAEADTFFRGEGVHVAADGIHLASDVLRRTRLCAFEHHVLDEVGDTIPLRIFVARAAFYPNSNRDRTNVLHLLGDQGQPVGEHLTADIAVGIHGLTIVTHWKRRRGIIANVLRNNDLRPASCDFEQSSHNPDFSYNKPEGLIAIAFYHCLDV